MKSNRYIWGCVVGAVATVLFLRAETYVSDCIVGSNVQESLDVAAYTPAIVHAVTRAHGNVDLPGVSLDEAVRVAVFAWSHLQRCALERGLEYCQAVGTEDDMFIFPESKGGPPREDQALFRYSVPDNAPGGRFEMRFRLEGYSEWTQIYMRVFDQPNMELEIDLDWRRCVGSIDARILRSSFFTKLGTFSHG